MIDSNRTDTIYVIYVPGLGDRYDVVRRVALWTWRFHVRKIRVLFVPMNWSDSVDTYETKVRRIAETISKLPASSRIILIGESAGGAMVLSNWIEDRRVDTIVTVAGKNRGWDGVGERTYVKNPAFREAMKAVEAALPQSSNASRSRVVTVYSPYDTTVPPEDTMIPNAQEITIEARGHLMMILSFLFWRFRQVLRLLRV